VSHARSPWKELRRFSEIQAISAEETAEHAAVVVVCMGLIVF
jgi:hypothetical protein